MDIKEYREEFRDYQLLSEYLERARIMAGAKMESLCNERNHSEALVFSSIRDSLAQNIQLLKDYAHIKGII